jgi:hypothetical protein
METIMIPVTENDLEKIKNDQESKDGKKYHWDTFNVGDSGWDYTARKMIVSGKWCLGFKGDLLMFRCWDCDAPFLIGECDNCGSDKYFFSHSGDTVTPKRTCTVIRRYSCGDCSNSIDSWKCTNCGSQNKIHYAANYLLTSKKCFIATACYGSYDAPEVEILRKFRDTRLLHSTIGKQFVKGYYYLSPPIASWLSDKKKLKTLLRYFFFKPLIRLLTKSEKRGDDGNNHGCN